VPETPRLTWPPAGDAVLAAVLTGLTLATTAGRDGPLGWDEAVASVLTVAPVALRQRAPVATMAVMLAAEAVRGLVADGTLPTGALGVVIAMFTVAMLRPPRVAAAMFAAACGTIALIFATSDDDFVWSEIAQSLVVVAGAWLLGETTKRWSQRAEALAADAARAVAEERVRIARELHDVVAHHMSVISVQSGVAEYVWDSDPATARRALGAVGESGREALGEMRRMLDVLRDGEEGGLEPQPGLGELEALLERTRRAGVPVTAQVTGRPRALPPGADLCAYRVVQESLTNVLRHAGPATATVALDFGERRLEITVRDDGAGSARSARNGSHGIQGMRERAALYGGTLAAGPGPDGGFVVTLRLPLQAAA
jgi:signal transduction histidine kinase